MKHTRASGRRLEKLISICGSLPEVAVAVIGREGEHRSFIVRKEIFGYYTFDHHGDGREALLCKAPAGEQGRLVEEDPRRFFVPPYVGPQGWVGVRLDVGKPDWSEIAYLTRAAYRLTAPRTLGARLE